MYLWWSLHPLYLHACQVRVTVGDSGLCCEKHTLLSADSFQSKETKSANKQKMLNSKYFLQSLMNNWLPISERIKYKVTCMCFSAINGSGPAYLSELLHVYTPSCTLCSSSDTRMLEIQQYKHKTHGFRTFSCFGPHIWNSLRQDLRHCSALSSFKAKLKTFLFSQYFHPN